MSDKRVKESNTKARKSNAAPVRHTLTSMYRLLKANPLLKYQLKGEPIPDVSVDFKDKLPEKILPKIASTSQLNTTKPAVKKPLVRSYSLQRVPKKTLAVKPPVIPKETKQKPPRTTKQEQNIEFKAPNAHKRRSTILATANTCNSKMRPSFASTPGPSAYDLQKRLNDWLRKHGKPIKSFDNLRNFGIKHDTLTKNEENKENIEVEEVKDDSYEDLGIIQEDKVLENKEKVKTENEIRKDMEMIAKDALKDLKKLILEGYPREQCEAWLGAIREKYKNLEEDPVYWECLAALEETVGHLTTAVEYYRTAIIQGAEVKEVDESLEQMLQKFSLLNISSSEKHADAEKSKYDRNKIVLAARNVFKSSIIQFAIEERKQKKGKSVCHLPEEKKRLIVTPVRRSTRRRTGYVLTPNVEMCSTIENIKDTDALVEFRHNQTLAAKF